MKNSRLYGKILGTLVGGAIGDAFGIRTEMMHYRDIERQYGRITHFDSLPPRQPSEEPIAERFHPFGPRPAIPPGSFHPSGRWGTEVGGYTDDMRYRLIALRAILRKRGPITGMDLAAEWLNYRLMAEGAKAHLPTYSWPAGPELEYARSVGSLESLVAMASRQRACDPGWDAPVGLIHAGDPEQSCGDAVAIAIATAMTPDATIGGVIENVLRYTGTMGIRHSGFKPRLQRALEIADECGGDIYAYREPFYREMLVTFPPYENVFALEIIPCALAMCYMAKGDPAKAIIGATNLGRDCDTSAAIAGEIMGALQGAQAFPANWVEKVLRLNPEPDMESIAEELCGILIERNKAMLAQAGKILSMT